MQNRLLLGPFTKAHKSILHNSDIWSSSPAFLHLATAVCTPHKSPHLALLEQMSFSSVVLLIFHTSFHVGLSILSVCKYPWVSTTIHQWFYLTGFFKAVSVWFVKWLMSNWTHSIWKTQWMQANHQSWLKASYQNKQTKLYCPEGEVHILHPELAFSATEEWTGSSKGPQDPFSLK